MMKIFYCFLLLVTIAGCKDKTGGLKEYEKLKEKEMASGKREDSLFFGIYLGMSSKDFYTHCWELNKKGMFTDGMNNTAVACKIDSIELGHPGHMFFYPDFIDDRIAEMRVTFTYDSWAPWNKNLFSDSLLPRVLNLYRKWYGAKSDFIEVNDKQKGTIYIKIDGNRRITIGRADEMKVRVSYTDLPVEEKIIQRLKNRK